MTRLVGHSLDAFRELGTGCKVYPTVSIDRSEIMFCIFQMTMPGDITLGSGTTWVTLRHILIIIELTYMGSKLLWSYSSRRCPEWKCTRVSHWCEPLTSYNNLPLISCRTSRQEFWPHGTFKYTNGVSRGLRWTRYLLGQDSGYPAVNFDAWNLNAAVNTHVNVQADHAT